MTENILNKNIKNNQTGRGDRKPRPDWLKVKAPSGDNFSKIKLMMKEKSLHTVCEEARCPNISECWQCGTATFIILGDVCNRSCRFCAIKTGQADCPDPNEPQNVAESVRDMKLKHAVITSVTRDDLPDGGANHWAETIRQVKSINSMVSVEVLIPDFKGDLKSIKIVLDARPDILNHNVETVPGLYSKVRPQANYKQSLEVLEYAVSKGFKAKTGLMVGLGETKEEVVEVMKDLFKIGVSILTIGQYLQPTREHLAVEKYVIPEEFAEYKSIALEMGFRHVESSPLVRSSYHAENHTK